ncbi:hypothetical protein DEU56DRAFT_793858 [Suillus clintonianus]|uniref:uncharacterized protein n=1 Tax=Suillus clintonianus TaxID=1904413 RepID=UPI001B85EB8E|nr:uncharacterized protein DEU56DRAFT_793858 [Suillus clintonianus]KAG2142382.1 hypothetical protein DEU56DRAFT_793858 [Suillus clintonianus]
MSPPHTRFNVLFRNYLSHHLRHSFNRDEAQKSSLETVLEDGPDSLDQLPNTGVDGRLQLFSEPEVSCVDCALSDSDHFSNEQASPTPATFEHRVLEPTKAWDFAVGAPRLLAKAHIFQRQLETPTAQPVATYSPPDHPTGSACPDPISPTSSEISSTPVELITTTAATSKSSTYNTPQPSNVCGTSASYTSSCSAVCGRHPHGSTPSRLPSSYADCPTLSTASGIPPTSTASIFTEERVSLFSTVYSLQTLTATTTLLPPLSSTVTSTSTVMTSIPLPQPTSAPSTNSNPQLPPTIGAIIGGTVGAVVLLALLAFIVLRRRRTRQLSVTPFNLISTTGPTQVESRAWLKLQNASGVVRPSSSSSSFIQYSDACLAEYSDNRSLSYATDHRSSHLADDDVSASGVARRYRAHELEKLYPYPSHVHTSDQYHHRSVESWIDHMVTDGCWREPSEELPAYPLSVKSLRSMEADHDDHYVLPSSYPPLPQTIH